MSLKPVNRVLLIEDDLALRQSIQQTLELESLEVIPTNGLVQARRTIRSNFRGIILTDIKMPDQDGFDVLRFVKTKDTDLPLIMITGFSNVSIAMRSVKEGAYDYLEKPCQPTQLIDTVKRALNHRRLALENRLYKHKINERSSSKGKVSLAEQLAMTEKSIIENELMKENGKVTEVAKNLNIPRNTLYDKINKHRIVIGKRE